MSVRDIDRYGRLVARVVVDGQDVNVALVEQGLAWHYTRYSDDPVLAKAEADARAAQIAIWGQSDPIPPWDFRCGIRGSQVEASEGELHGNRRSKVFHRPGCPNYDCKRRTRSRRLFPELRKRPRSTSLMGQVGHVALRVHITPVIGPWPIAIRQFPNVSWPFASTLSVT